MAGCSLDSPIKYGMDCEASSIQLESGKICMPGECPNYDVYLENKACPADAPYCVAKDGRQYCSFLRQTCEASFVMLANGERYESGQNDKYNNYLSNQICPIEAPYCWDGVDGQFCSSVKMRCNAEYIQLGNGDVYRFGEKKDYELYFKYQICPTDAPYCRTESGHTFCSELREDCPPGTFWTGNGCKTGNAENCDSFEFIAFIGKAEIMPSEDNEDYHDNFRNGVCPSEAPFCMTLGEMKTSSADIRYCSDRRDKCPDGAHWFEGMCEWDTAEHCGSHDNNCLDRQKGIAEAECVDDEHGKKTCRATVCMETYILASKGECRADNECCGDNCEDCSRESKVCISLENHDDMFCSDGCPSHSPIECNGVCINPMTSLTYCGTENCELRYCPDIIEGWRSGNCVAGQCKVSECMTGYHLVNDGDGNRCEKNTPTACGENAINCETVIAHADAVECVLGECRVVACSKGYSIYDNACESDSEEHCGEDRVVCHAPENGSVSCVDGACQVKCPESYYYRPSEDKCIESCNGGAPHYVTFCGNQICADFEKDVENCGGCNNKCSTKSITYSTSVACDHFACRATECVSNYVSNGTICCKKSSEATLQMDGAMSCHYECSEPGYYFDGTACVKEKCPYDTTRCANNGTTGKLERCNGQEWVEESTCNNDYSCNADGTACGVCVNGSTKCFDTSSRVGEIRTCVDGAYSTANAVSCGNVSCSNSECGTCLNGSKQCSYCGDGGWLHTCYDGTYNICSRNGRWASKCESGKNCYSGGTSCN